MRRRRSRRKVPELLVREVKISSIAIHVSLIAGGRRGSRARSEASSWLVLNGIADEPVRDVSAAESTVSSRDRTESDESRSVGAVLQTRPVIVVYFGFPVSDFDRIWSLALSGELRYVRFVSEQPRYNKASVTSVSFSSVPEE